PPPMTQLRRPAEPAAPAPPPIVAPPPIPTPPQTHLAPAPPRPQVPSLPGVVVPHSAPPAPALPIQPPPVTRPSGTTVGQAAVLAAQKARPAPEPPPPAAPPAPLEKDRPRPGKSDPRVLATAAFLGAAEASNAAATAPTEDDRERERRDKPAITPPAATPAPAGFLVDLLWFAAELPPRLPENEAWKPLFEPAAPAAPEEPESEASEDPWNDEDLEAPPPKPRKKPERKKEKTPEEKAKEDKSRVSRVLTRGIPTLDVENALFSSVNDDGVLEPPLLVVAGELELPFDEIEVLKVLSSAAAPLAVGDKKLKETLDLANEALGTPLGSSADVAANLSLRVREAWAKANRMLPPDYLDVHSRRVLLEQRKYQKRELSGAEWIRALLHGPMADKGIPTYLPLDLSKKLPLFSRFSARLIVEAVPQQDQSESQIVALRVLALARTVAGRPKR
ncbi:hypothetical protein QHF83_41605, partial [Polyangium sp. 15x6]|nr:hypothetical protein [Polyangium sp. 15x6]